MLRIGGRTEGLLLTAQSWQYDARVVRQSVAYNHMESGAGMRGMHAFAYLSTIIAIMLPPALSARVIPNPVDRFRSCRPGSLRMPAPLKVPDKARGIVPGRRARNYSPGCGIQAILRRGPNCKKLWRRWQPAVNLTFSCKFMAARVEGSLHKRRPNGPGTQSF